MVQTIAAVATTIICTTPSITNAGLSLVGLAMEGSTPVSLEALWKMRRAGDQRETHITLSLFVWQLQTSSCNARLRHGPDRQLLPPNGLVACSWVLLRFYKHLASNCRAGCHAVIHTPSNAGQA